ncbi:MAG: hypothetical protein QFX36_08460 [Archaeoglobales archaeon]|nr:hypothetical protein [Archaeoglobales archaeon]MDI9641965.1 hypothetical protein [Archaeoglobales archaeon]
MDLICRFVFKDGKEFGESIDVFDNHLIVKVYDKFIAIPMKCVNFDGEKITVTDFDEQKALELGNKWVEKSKAVSEEELKNFGFGDGV